MRTASIARYLCLAALATATCAFAQQKWEVGGMGGGSFALNNSVTAGSATGNVGFDPGFSAGGWLGHTTSSRYGGEIRYLFEKSDLKLASGGNKYTFGGQSHLMHYDFLIHTGSPEKAFRPFVAMGGGIKGYIGTGAEKSFQPMSNLAILSHTSQWEPLISVGGGIKWSIGARTMIRVEVRDYITPMPKDVILPSPGASISGWINNITPMVGISYILQ